MRSLKRVCDSVEQEAQKMKKSEGVDGKMDEEFDVSDVLESWTEEQLHPRVLVEDFVQASKDIVPSISESDLKRFEVLRNQFSAVL